MFEHFREKKSGDGLCPPPKSIQGLDIFSKIGGP